MDAPISPDLMPIIQTSKGIKILFRLLAILTLLAAIFFLAALGLQILTSKEGLVSIIRTAIFIILGVVEFYGFWTLKSWTISILFLVFASTPLGSLIASKTLYLTPATVVVGSVLILSLALRRHLKGRYLEPLPIGIFIIGLITNQLIANL